MRFIVCWLFCVKKVIKILFFFSLILFIAIQIIQFKKNTLLLYIERQRQVTAQSFPVFILKCSHKTKRCLSVPKKIKTKNLHFICATVVVIKTHERQVVQNSCSTCHHHRQLANASLGVGAVLCCTCAQVFLYGFV